MVSTRSSNRGLSLNQFLDLIIDRQHDSKDNFDEILNGFKMFDYGKWPTLSSSFYLFWSSSRVWVFFQDNSGVLTVENLRRACVETGVKLSETELNEMIQEADVNGDGCVDQNEFVSLMVRTNLYSFNWSKISALPKPPSAHSAPSHFISSQPSNQPKDHFWFQRFHGFCKWFLICFE